METSAAILAFFKSMLAKGLLPAIIGSFIAAVISDAKSKKEWLFYFVVGVFTSHYAGGGIIAWWSIESELAHNAVKFGIGLIGIGIVIQIISQIPVAIRSLRLKFIGHDPDSTRGTLK